MNVRLIAISKPVIGPDPETRFTAEDLMVYCARVSNPSNQSNVETGDRLLRYCIQHGHWSVFETASMTVEIRTSRAIAQQILRHRSFTFQEFSQRYSVATDFEPVELRLQGEKNRQGGELVIEPDARGLQLHASVKKALDLAQSVYDELLEHGVAKECARMVLPLCTQSTLYMTGSVRSWIHYLKQRLDGHAQKEHRAVAQEIASIFGEQFPKTWMALNDSTAQ